MRTVDERYKELIEKHDTIGNDNKIFIVIKDDNDCLITKFDTLFTIGNNRLFKNVESAVKKFHNLLSNTIVKSRMINSYRFELVVNDVVEMVIYKAIPMSNEIYEKMKYVEKNKK